MASNYEYMQFHYCVIHCSPVFSQPAFTDMDVAACIVLYVFERLGGGVVALCKTILPGHMIGTTCVCYVCVCVCVYGLNNLCA